MARPSEPRSPPTSFRSAAACASRGRSSRSSCRWSCSSCSLEPARVQARRHPRQIVAAANPALLLAAFLVFYLGFPLRGLRWAILIRGTGYRLKVRDSTEIIFISWLVNCLVPAKLGDIYRAYLLKINSPVSLSRTFGTVFIERILDLFAIVVLGLRFGFVSFREGLPAEVQVVFAIGLGVVIVLAVGLLTMRNFGRRIIVRLPLPHSVVELYDRFEEGVFGDHRAARPAGSRRDHRAHLDHRGAPALPRDPGARVQGRPARASAARSSSR